MSGWLILGEAIALGAASGPACIASCGPVLVPSLLAEGPGVRLNVRYLSTFLSTRLIGYLLFATIAWEVGSLASLSPATRATTLGIVHLLMTVVLLRYAYTVGRSCFGPCANELVSIGTAGKRSLPAGAAVGFLTGISLCPPFVVAGLRASELNNLAAALIFFGAFFVGTSIWFVPFVGLGCVRRNEAVKTVARMTMVLIAIYYGFVGLTILLGRKSYGY